MREELDDLLCKKYPKLFADRNKPMTETCMCWGFECRDAWFDLIDNLCSSIQNHVDYNHAPQVVVEQVKEKFGTLRFYYRGGDEKISGMVWHAENLSGKTCEVCGAPGKTRGKGWYYTACDKHAKPGDLDDSL